MVTDRAVKKAEKPLNYEMVVVLSPEVVEDNLETAINTISNFITSRGGTISQQDRWGKRMLAYPIKHFSQGTYVLSRFILKPSACRDLENTLRINDHVLRHLLIKQEIITNAKKPGLITPVAAPFVPGPAHAAAPAAPVAPAPAAPPAPPAAAA